jgi:toxin secretion/phage lysis holin
MINLTDIQKWGIILACIMMCADVLVGFIGAIIQKNISSIKMREGILHKILMLILIFLCLVIEIASSHMFKLSYDIPTCEVICGYTTVMELSSIIENISTAYPEFAKSGLAKLFNLQEKKEINNDERL